MGCTNIIFSTDNCRLNIESTCINGQDVNLYGSATAENGNTLNNEVGQWGFTNSRDSQLQNGLSAANFPGQNPKDPNSRMYKVREGMVDRQLCTYIEGAQFRPSTNHTLSEKDLEALGGKDSWTTESVPSYVVGGTSEGAAKGNYGSMTLHQKITYKSGLYQVSLQVKESSAQVDHAIPSEIPNFTYLNSNGNPNRSLSVTGAPSRNLSTAYQSAHDALFSPNRMAFRCMPSSTFNSPKAQRWFADNQMEETEKEIRGHIAKSEYMIFDVDRLIRFQKTALDQKDCMDFGLTGW